MVAVIALVIPLSGCVSMRATKHTYAPDVSSPPVKVNGANVRLQLRPEGTRGSSYVVSAMVVAAAATTLDGPFRWRIEATGQTNRQESMVIHRLRTQTKLTNRDEWYPERYLGQRVDFTRPSGTRSPWRAVFEIPGTLQVKPREDGELEILADLSIRADGKTQRKVVKFRLDPSKSRQDEFIFVPTEIVKSIGKPMSEWDETGWD